MWELGCQLTGRAARFAELCGNERCSGVCWDRLNPWPSLNRVLLREDIEHVPGLLFALLGLVTLIVMPARCPLYPRDSLLDASISA
jgi:hypothetical protein